MTSSDQTRENWEAYKRPKYEQTRVSDEIDPAPRILRLIAAARGDKQDPFAQRLRTIAEILEGRAADPNPTPWWQQMATKERRTKAPDPWTSRRVRKLARAQAEGLSAQDLAAREHLEEVGGMEDKPSVNEWEGME